MIVRFTRRALNDLSRILGYLDERSPRGSLNVKLAIKRHRRDQRQSRRWTSDRPEHVECRSVAIPISSTGRLRRTKYTWFTFGTERANPGATDPTRDAEVAKRARRSEPECQAFIFLDESAAALSQCCQA
jgi:hypothetical protein